MKEREERKKEREEKVTSGEITEKSRTSFEDFFKEELSLTEHSLRTCWTWRWQISLTSDDTVLSQRGLNEDKSAVLS